jgi:hypothetical protein
MFGIFLICLILTFSIAIAWMFNIIGETNSYERQRKRKQEEEDRA